MNFKVYIPARLASTRLASKLLLDLGGEPVIAATARQALASGAGAVVLATDDAAIADAVAPLGIDVVMSQTRHDSGTDRIAEAVRLRGEGDDEIIVNLQGDEAEMPPAVIAQVAALLAEDPNADIATIAEPLDSARDFDDPNIVKVVCNAAGHALYFSRAPIPWERDGAAAGNGDGAHRDAGRRHVGIYAYRVATLARFSSLPAAPLERLEALEQLRALHHGMCIAVADAVAATGIGIDTAADLERARARRGAGS